MGTDLKTILNSIGLKQDEFKDRVVIVTGAGRGIGFQAARAFALLGGKVVLAEKSAEGKQAEELIRRENGTALYVQSDVADCQSINELASRTHERFGPADILVNNAVLCPVASVMDMDESLWEQVMAVNLRGTFLTCKAFLPDMLSRRSGTIINMISPNPMPGLSAYIASKHGMIGFSQCLAQEVGSEGVRVIPFGPGMVDTPAIRDTAVELAPKLGMTPDQFMGISIHAAYEGLMPAEHAGAATVYLAARLAEEFQGEVTDGYEILEKAGFLHTTVELNTTSAKGSTAPAGDSLELVRQLASSLLETEAEFNKLPAFIRPMARSGFKNKTGQSLADWQKTVIRLEADIRAGRDPSQANLAGLLEKLYMYFRDVPKETSRFTRDTDFLQQIGEISRQRMALIDSLIQAFNKARSSVSPLSQAPG
jgi:NAD(P)-dependent dehydrogenase (short-subunit alcohol dehydrogenase family)